MPERSPDPSKPTRRRVVLDASTLISLAHGSVLELVLQEFHVLASELAWKEVQRTAGYDDPDEKAARKVVQARARLEVRPVDEEAYAPLLGRRVEEGEASGLVLARDAQAEAFLCDDFDALPYLERHAAGMGVELGLGAVLIRALVHRGRLTPEEARRALERIGQGRGWLGRPIYEQALRTLEGEADRRERRAGH